MTVREPRTDLPPPIEPIRPPVGAGAVLSPAAAAARNRSLRARGIAPGRRLTHEAPRAPGTPPASFTAPHAVPDDGATIRRRLIEAGVLRPAGTFDRSDGPGWVRCPTLRLDGRSLRWTGQDGIGLVAPTSAASRVAQATARGER